VCQKLFINTLGLKCSSKIIKLYQKCYKLKFNYQPIIGAPIDQRVNNRVNKRKHSIDFRESLEDIFKINIPKPSHYGFEIY